MKKPIHILVVDDEPDIEFLFRQKFRREIKAQTIQFHFELSAEAALEYLEKIELEKIELKQIESEKDSNTNQAAVVSPEATLILSDINMPGMNGLELLKIVKQKRPLLPVFMVTAYGDEQSQKTATAYGASGFINKPVNFPHLKELITNLALSTSAV